MNTGSEKISTTKKKKFFFRQKKVEENQNFYKVTQMVQYELVD